MWVQSMGGADTLEEAMATHSSLIGWEIPWTEEPGGLQLTSLQRVGHDWVTQHTHTFCDADYKLTALVFNMIICPLALYGENFPLPMPIEFF